MKRFRELIVDTPSWPRLAALIDESENSWLRALGKNDFHHSKSIEMILDRLVPDVLKQDQSIFDLGEIYLLLAAVYLHDIGRCDARGHHELRSYERIKASPADFHLRDTFEATAIAQICAAHADEAVWPIEKCDPSYGIAALTSAGKTFNLRNLGALLRLADELDNTYIRVRGLLDQDGSPRHLIRDINPVFATGIIEMQTDPATWKDWDALIGIRNYTQTRLAQIQRYIADLGLHYYQIWLSPQHFSAPLVISAATSDDELVQTVGLVMERTYSEVELFPTVEEVELSALGTDFHFGVATRTAVVVRRALDAREASEISGALSYLKQQTRVHTALVVLGSPPEESVVRHFRERDIHVRTVGELISDEYGLSRACTNYIRDYEKSDLWQRNLYVPVTASHEDNTPNELLQTFVERWCENQPEVQLTILGDFGAGKTTFCEHLRYELAQRFLADPHANRFPVLLRLRDIAGPGSMEATITNAFVNELGIVLNFKAFQTLNRTGRFLLILDGFDEIPDIHTEEAALQAFRQLDVLVEPRAKVILTCRTHFYKDTDQVHRVHRTALYSAVAQKHGYRLINMDPFTPAQVEQYLVNWAENEEDAASYRQMISRIYNLRDLAQRPVLLNIIVKTVRQLEGQEVRKLNAASLYEMYIGFWLDRDDWRSRLDVPTRRDLALCVAHELFFNGVTCSHYKDLPNILQKWSGRKQDFSVEVLDHDLRTCNFLRRNARGEYSFVHRSFMEYLLAWAFCRELFDSSSDVRLAWRLPLEGDGPQNASRPLATKEIEDFVVQLAQLRLAAQGPSGAARLAKKGARSEVLVTSLLRRCEWRDYGWYYAEMLRCGRARRRIQDLANGLLASTNAEQEIRGLCGSFARSVDFSLMWDVHSALNCGKGVAHDAIEELQRFIEQREAEHESASDVQAAAAGYPFARSKRKQLLQEVLETVSEENQAAIRRKFMREWHKEKAEYDDGVRKTTAMSAAVNWEWVERMRGGEGRSRTAAKPGRRRSRR